jgi:hypothetical protein
MGAENSKHFGIKSGASECKSLVGNDMGGFSYFWDCCNAENIGDQGCFKGRHISYDEARDEFNMFVIRR